MKRCLLHKEKIEQFKSYLIKNNIQYRGGKGDFQVIQVEISGIWHPLYKRYSGDHFTATGDLITVIKNFIKSK